MAAIVREQRVVRRERGVRPFQPLVHEAELEVRVLVRGHQAHRSAQRLGRVLRPKKDGAFFYSVVTRDSKEQEFAMKRQLFLTEQGYRYYIQETPAS